MNKLLSKAFEILAGTALFLLAAFMIVMLFYFAVHPPPPPPQVHIQMLTITEDGKTVTVPVLLPTNITFKLQ